MKQDSIRRSYNRIARDYQLYREQLAGSRPVKWLMERLPPQSTILDVGCGSGSIIDEQLIKAGHLVTGLDISDEQIRLARHDYPRGNFLVRDMLTLAEGEYAVDAVVSMYALFHISREKHHEMLSIWASYLPKGGWLLVTMGDTDFEGDHIFLGSPMWTSHYGMSKNRQIVQAAGFAIERDELDRSGGERHQLIFARKC